MKVIMIITIIVILIMKCIGLIYYSDLSGRNGLLPSPPRLHMTNIRLHKVGLRKKKKKNLDAT